ncbi:hypothetical protein JYT14_00255 [Flavobacteriales bacterium AH-315-E23]|nr:hypothetical protein [Flavobacteriales bacterium AH-315-E23]
MQNKINIRFGTLTTIVLVAAFSRLLPHIDNVTPIAAMCLFGGAYFTNKRMAFVIPLLAMFLSDMVINYLAGYPLFSYFRLILYATFAVIVLIGLQLRNRVNGPRTLLASLIGSVLFFVVTNFFVWALGNGIEFPLTLNGLLSCYNIALPFFRNTIGGDLFFVAVLFGGFELAKAKFPALSRVEG